MELNLKGEPREFAQLFKELGALRVPRTERKPAPVTKVGVTRPKKVQPKPTPFSKHRRNKKWSPKEKKYALKMSKQGRKSRLIGKDIGRSTQAVAVKLSEIRRGVSA